MMGHIKHLWLWIALTAMLLSPLCHGEHFTPDTKWRSVKRAAPQPSPTKILWRGELTRTPQDVQRAGGLYAEGLEKIAHSGRLSGGQLARGCSLFSHAYRRSAGFSQYISTSSDPFAALFLETLERNITEHLDDSPVHLYQIHIDRTMFELNSSLGIHNAHPAEPEWVAVGMIPWDQVMGWYEVTLNTLSTVFDTGMTIKKNAPFNVNPKYNGAVYNSQEGGDPQPQLAAFPADSPAWKFEPWRSSRGKSISELLGNYVWHRVCGKDYNCYRQRRPLLRSSSVVPRSDGIESPQQDVAVRGNPPRVVFIGHYLWPEEVKKQRGFLTAADRVFRDRAAPPEAYTLQHHLDVYNKQRSTFFLQASENFGTAAEWASESAKSHTPGFEGVVYAVHATPNMIDIGLTRGHHYGDVNPMKQRFAIAGGIKWSQVLGWVQVPQNFTKIPASEIGSRDDIRAHFEKAFKEEFALFEPNPDYDKKRFDHFAANDKAQKQLLTPSEPQKALTEFMDQFATPLGWTGKFPLFNSPHIGSANASREAKAAGKVAKPHSNSMTKKVRRFIDDHILALSILPQVVAAAVLPGGLQILEMVDAIKIGVAAVAEAGLAVEAFTATAQVGAGAALTAGVMGVRRTLAAADAVELELESLEFDI
ncbi:putative enterotoxin [Ophiocordyceps unilateralis]|uniref:Enterotoxin n=1 Tax=Ophiocordyceps unilateralis TaxID=268505 RepID=A0A2A9PHT2_OPHUN|nr:putative enterotoxin [Ophiocordyceps unilateralis]